MVTNWSSSKMFLKQVTPFYNQTCRVWAFCKYEVRSSKWNWNKSSRLSKTFSFMAILTSLINILITLKHAFFLLVKRNLTHPLIKTIKNFSIVIALLITSLIWDIQMRHSLCGGLILLITRMNTDWIRLQFVLLPSLIKDVKRSFLKLGGLMTTLKIRERTRQKMSSHGSVIVLITLWKFQNLQRQKGYSDEKISCASAKTQSPKGVTLFKTIHLLL